MKKFKFKEYQIEVFNDEDFTIDSADNDNEYDFIYSDIEHKEFQPTSKHGIQVFKDNDIYKSALVNAAGGATGIFEDSVIIDNESIIICCSDCVFSLALPNMSLNWVTEADIATCFGIFKITDGYIVHGEMLISRLNQLGEILWQQGGNDIFVSPSGDEGLTIDNEIITVKDFNDDEYKINLNGQIISDTVNKTKK